MAVEADFEVDPEDGCVGDSFNFLNLSTGATSYAWTFPSGTPASSTDENPSVSFASAGRYMVKLVATDGTDSDSLEFEVEIFSNPTPTITEVSAGVLETETFDSYQWTLDGNDLNGEDSQSHTATADGSYTVTVTDMNGCSTTSAAYDYEEVTQTASVTEVNGNTLILYPNPSNGNITIEFGGGELRTIALFDASGRELSQWETNQSAFNANLDLNPGMYFVKVLSGSEEVVLSLVIK